MFLTQIYSTLLGGALNYVIMVVITNNQREILLDPIGNNVWSGGTVQSINTSSTSWSLAQYMYGLDNYWLVPIGLLVGGIAPILQKGINMLFPRTSKYEVNTIVIFTYAGWCEYVMAFRKRIRYLRDRWLNRFPLSLSFRSELRKYFLHRISDSRWRCQSSLDQTPSSEVVQRVQLSGWSVSRFKYDRNWLRFSSLTILTFLSTAL